MTISFFFTSVGIITQLATRWLPADSIELAICSFFPKIAINIHFYAELQFQVNFQKIRVEVTKSREVVDGEKTVGRTESSRV